MPEQIGNEGVYSFDEKEIQELVEAQDKALVEDIFNEIDNDKILKIRDFIGEDEVLLNYYNTVKAEIVKETGSLKVDRKQAIKSLYQYFLKRKAEKVYAVYLEKLERFISSLN